MPKILVCFLLLVLSVSCLAKAKEGERLPDARLVQDVPALVALLNSPDPLDRVQSLNALLDLRQKAVPAIPTIAALLGDQGGPVFDYMGSGGPTRVGERASFTLQFIGNPAIPALIAAMQHDSDEARVNASRALRALSGSNPKGLDLALWPIVLAALQSPNDVVSHNAASMLLDWHKRRALITGMLSSGLGEDIIISLPLPVESFLKAAKDKRAFVRRTILQFLPAIADGRGRDKIFEALKDPDASVRQTAVGLIAAGGDDWLYDPRSLEPLLLALRSDFAGGNYVSRAAYSLGRYKDPRATDALLFALKTDKDHRYNIVEGIRMLKDPKAVEPLMEILKTEDFPTGDLIATTLADLGDKRAIPVLADYFARRPGYVSGDAFEKLSGQNYRKYKAAQEAKSQVPQGEVKATLPTP